MILRPPSAPTLLPNAGGSALWTPNPGPQTLLLACPCFEIFYGGARGGGKTEGSIGDWLIHSAQYGENAIGIFVRRKLTQLSEVIARTKKLFYRIGATYNEQQKTWTMPGGGRLRFVYLERDADAENYQGHEYTRVYLEEATNFPSPDPINKLKATLRSSAGVPCSMRLTGNPGGPGHHWVKARYIDQGAFTVTKTEEAVEMPDGTVRIISIDRTYIPAKLRDNPKLLENDPGYILRLRQSGSAALVKAWLEGLWDEVEGAFFAEWDEAKHVIFGPLDLPPHWPRFRAFDWGSAKPFSVGWYAVSDGTRFRRGALIRYQEWYGVRERLDSGRVIIEPNKGLVMHAGTVARGVVARETVPVAYGVADPSIFITNGGPSIGETMLGEGCSWIRADNSRAAGWEQVRSRLAPEEGGPPLLLFHESCIHARRTLPYLQHDEKNMEDLDSDAEDHVADEVRYACMSRVGALDPQPQYRLKLPPLPSGLTILEHLARQRQRTAERANRY